MISVSDVAYPIDLVFSPVWLGQTSGEVCRPSTVVRYLGKKVMGINTYENKQLIVAKGNHTDPHWLKQYFAHWIKSLILPLSLFHTYAQ